MSEPVRPIIMFYSVKETTFDYVGMNCKTNNTKLWRLQAEQTQWKCVHCLLTKCFLSIAHYDTCMEPGNCHLSYNILLRRIFIAKLIDTSSAIGTPVSQHTTDSLQPHHLTLLYYQALGAAESFLSGHLLNGSPPKSIVSNRDLGGDNIFCVWQHSSIQVIRACLLKSLLQFQL